MDMQSLQLMYSHWYIAIATQSEDARNSLPCYFVEQYTVLGGKSVFNNSYSVTFRYTIVASLPFFMALTAQNPSCHMVTWLWVSLRMTLVSLLYFKIIIFEGKLEIVI